MKIARFILRLIAFPFVLGIVLVAYNIYGLKNAWNFLKHGGEWSTYRKEDRATMQSIYQELKDQRNG